MEQHREEGGGGEPEPSRPRGATDALTMTVLQRYAAGEISSRQAAKALGPGIVAAHLSLPQPTPEELAKQVAALRAFYGPHGPHPHR